MKKSKVTKREEAVMAALAKLMQANKATNKDRCLKAFKRFCLLFSQHPSISRSKFTCALFDCLTRWKLDSALWTPGIWLTVAKQLEEFNLQMRRTRS